MIASLAAILLAGCSGGGGGHVPGPTAAAAPFALQIDPAVEQLASAAHVDVDAVVRQELVTVAAALRSPKATVALLVNPRATIPEVGVGGFTNPESGVVTVSIDPNSRIGIAQTLRVWLPLTLAHELDHSARILGGPGYGNTLVETIVTEGIADEFSRSLHPDAPAIPWDNALKASQEHDLWATAQGQTTSFALHAEWFFGTGRVPRWAGYTLGAHLVAAYRAKNAAVPWADVTRLPAPQIVAASGYRP